MTLSSRHYTIDEKLHYGIPMSPDETEELIDAEVERQVEARFAHMPVDLETCEAEAWTSGKDFAMENFNAQPLWRRIWIAIIGYRTDLEA